MIEPRGSRWFTATLGVAVLLLGTLPFSNWIAGGLSDAAYARRWQEWLLGSLICAGAGIVCMLVVNQRAGARIREALLALGARLPTSTRTTDLAVALACFVAYAVASQLVLSGRPLLIDEIVQVLQARTYSGGELSTPVDSLRGFFSVLHVVDVGDRVYSQFPPGWPAMMVLPSLLQLEWLAGPLCGLIAVFAFSRLLRRVFAGAHPLLVPVGALLFGLAPFILFQFASHMSHGPVVMWLLLATLWLSDALDSAEPLAIRRALLAGFALGCAFAVRPLDAIAFGAALAMTVLGRGFSATRLRLLASVVAGGIIPAALVAFVNARTTGSPLMFGYEALWGATHGLGFHASPWGEAHTPGRGLELLSMYVTRLNVYLFESPLPALLPAIAGLLLASRLTRVEWLLLSGACVHAALYFAYWHDGFYLGPRFVLPWVPIAIVLALRGARAVATAATSPRLKSALAGAATAAVILSLVVALPVRISQYQSGLTSMRPDYSAEAAQAGVSNSVVFVRESWGARLIARLWALGVTRTATASLYSSVDACVLEHAVTALEQGSVRGSAAENSLRPLLSDASKVRASSVSPDTTERMLPGSVYDPVCSERVREDREGYALFPPLLLERKSGNLYVRDLLAADTLIMDRYPDRRYFVLSRDGVDGNAPLRWSEVSRSSLSHSDSKPNQ